MGRNGGCDFRGVKEFEKKLEKLTSSQHQEFMETCAKELAARLLAKVVKRTPVGKYPNESGKKGGTLRRGWTGGEQHWSEKDGKTSVRNIGGGTGYAQSLKVNKVGNSYQIEIVNPTEYASYVEFGHRTRNHKGWVQGKFMLTISEQEIETAAPAILERKLLTYLAQIF